MKTRSNIFIAALAIIFVFFALRLIQLQIIEYPKYARKSSENAAKITPILAPRGIIFDRNGKVLLKNRPVFMLYILPHLLPKDPAPVFQNLSSILGTSPQELQTRFKLGKRPIFEGILVQTDIPPQIVSKIEESRADLPGVEVISYPYRSYVYKRVASHVLGYIGEIEPDELSDMRDEGYRLGDLIGKDGVEKYYDKYLRGISGGKKLEVDAFGKPVKILEVVDPVPGYNMQLTLDIDLQQKVDEALGNSEGAVVVLNVKTGEILALASHPDYDANRVSDYVGRSNHPFMNRALSTYPPGSIFKVVTLSAALSEGITNLEEIFSCYGYYKMGLRTAKCWLARGHGKISPIEGLVWSCDVVFYELGRRLGPDKINAFAKRYGLGQRTEVDLPQEKRGFVPSSDWKKERFKENWYEGDSINMGIGQGFTQVTPIQMACVYATIATGQRMKPYIVQKIVDRDQKVLFENKPQMVDVVPLSKENISLMRSALADVVSRGTGVAAFVSSNEAAGKTGTAENPGIAHAWFVCYAPTSDPEIVISSFVAHGAHGDRVTAYIARDVLKWYEQYRLKNKMPARQRPQQYIMHKGYKEYYGRKINLDSD